MTFQKNYVVLLIFFLTLPLISASYAAEALPVPNGRPILSIDGSISVTNSPNAAVFDRELLLTLDQHVLEVETPWTDGVVKFKGPLLLDILKIAGAKGKEISAVALNDYAITIPYQDIENYPIIIAWEQDGKELHVRDKGPLWIIYPWGDYEELRAEVYYSRSIWQLKSITVN